MKAFVFVAFLMSLSATAIAHGGKKRMNRAVVMGPKAEAIYKALDVEEKTIDRPQFSVEAKKVGSLRCVKRTKKADTSVVKFSCALKGKKARRGFGRRGRGFGRRVLIIQNHR